MNNKSEKDMWRCKPMNNPWTLDSLLKKTISAVLPASDKVSYQIKHKLCNNELIKIEHPCSKFESRIDGDYIVSGGTEYRF
ncbi:hypothetical protein [Escherichia coli]|uniref:hypothetical protein n=1 Tax=Escherichia coli TaxID=562 RepID=UPI0010D3BA09|nr:hypothetical protein [Escherichia coli]GDO95318.1 hypothetical protein BvCmsNSNP012_00654 [Escherichia coli]